MDPVADATDTEPFDRLADVLGGSGLPGVRGQAEPGRRGDAEGPHHRFQRGKEELVPGDIESDDAPAGAVGRGAGDFLVRRGVVVPERACHEARRHARAADPLPEPVRGRCDDRADAHAARVGRGAEAQLEIGHAVRRSVLDGLRDDASDRIGGREERIGGRDVGEERRQSSRLAHPQRVLPAAGGRRNAVCLGELRGRSRADRPLEVGMEVQADGGPDVAIGHSDRATAVLSATSML